MGSSSPDPVAATIQGNEGPSQAMRPHRRGGSGTTAGVPVAAGASRVRID